ncbi:hypothetical protein [Janthinobacterium sp. MDB2-8]|uniref:hypothetical protein n=1 Tax=Janthinobacterium sp. MDB2-8 TaxID=1259338 RepID=UPI003F2652C7
MLSWRTQQGRYGSVQHVVAAKKQHYIARAAGAMMAMHTGFANLPFAAFAQSSLNRKYSLSFQVLRKVRRVIQGKFVTVFCKYITIFLLHCNINIIAAKMGGSALISTVFALFPNKLWRKTGLWKLRCCFKVMSTA